MFEKLIIFFIFTVLILISCNDAQLNDNDIADDDFIEDSHEEDDDCLDDDKNSYCDPNPCFEIEWSDGNCIEKNGGFECGCSEMFIWSGTACEGKTREVSCTGLPENTSWNSVEKITQKWTGTSWEPSEIGIFNMEESSTHCYFKCDGEYGWEDEEGLCKIKWESIATGIAHTCGIKKGRLYCWGNGYFGTLGNGELFTPSSSASPVRVLFDRDVVTKKDTLWLSVAAGIDHTCGILKNGEIYCWGSNEFSQLGDGTSGRNESKASPVRVLIEDGGTFVKISTKRSHTCAINTDGELYCWGKNQFGYLGDGTTVSRRYPAKIGEEIGPWKDVATGDIHTCGVTMAGELYCWGYNIRGQLGLGVNVKKSYFPSKVNEETDWSSVAAGFAHTCAVKSGGELFCWGANDKGQIGDDGGNCPEDYNVCSDRYAPVQIATEQKWSLVIAGHQNNFAESTDGDFFVWGSNRNYALNNSEDEYFSSPQNTNKSWETAALGGDNTLYACGIDKNKDLYCWGGNFIGQLGNGTKESTSEPIMVTVQ